MTQMERIMTTSESTSPTGRLFARALPHAARHYLSGWRGLLLLATIAMLIAVGFSWSWLVAAGIAPVLLSVLPCLVMCGLGLCMNKMVGGSCTSTPQQSTTPRAAQSESQALLGTQSAIPAEIPSPIQSTEKGETHA